MADEGNRDETHLDKIEARAGSRHKVNRNALVVGLLLVIVAFLMILSFGYRHTNETGADKISADNVAANEVTK